MRSWFGCSLNELVSQDPELIVGRLATAAADRRLDLNPESTASWRATVGTLSRAAAWILAKMPSAGDWHVGFEYELPRRRRRLDIVLLAGGLVILIEIKAGANSFERGSKWQAEQYALDLRDFHSESHVASIAPFLVATEAIASEPEPEFDARQVRSVQAVTVADLGPRILGTFYRHGLREPRLDPVAWENSPYKPSPSIVEAAQQLYANHDVTEIATSGSSNLDSTVEAIVDLIRECRTQNRRGIAFITGSPGSGKTLAGLQVAHDKRLTEEQNTSAVFLSGNMPLVNVIVGALAQDAEPGTKKRKLREISTFVQHAFSFRNEYADDPNRVPPEQVVLFDEAQRAWDAKQVTSWTRGRSIHSEPRLLLDVMSRTGGWSLVIAMVGGGQEINRGEAGLAEWGNVLAEAHSDWLVRAAPVVLPGAQSALEGGSLTSFHQMDWMSKKINASPFDECT
jgi:hypothetical protein